MKKLLSLLSVVTISGTSIPPLTAVNLYQKPKLKNLNDLIKKVDLGNILNNYEDTILHAITRLNPRIRINEIRIAQLFDRRARIVFADAPNNFNINDSVVVSFSISSEGIVGNSMFYNNPSNNLRLVPHRPAPPIPNPEITSNEIPEAGEPIYETVLFPNQIPPSEITSNEIPGTTEIARTKEPIYATVLPKKQRNKQNNLLSPTPKPRNLNNLLLKTDLGELPDNLPKTILNRLQELNPTLNLSQISLIDITTISAMIIANENSRYSGNIQVTFTLNAKNKDISNQTNENKPDDDSNSNSKKNIKNIITKFNNLSKQDKQDKLNEVNDYYQTLSENDKKNFNNKLKNIGLGLTSTGISGAGLLGISQMTGISPLSSLMKTIKIATSSARSGLSNTFSTSLNTIGESADAVEMTPLISSGTTEGLTTAETLATTAIEEEVIGEGTILGTEAATSAALAPETLGLSIVIGGMIIAGTSFLIWWFNSDSPASTKHESHNQYDEIEKYYKFLAHDQLKLDLSPAEWIKIKQIYKEYSNNYEKFKWKVKSKIINFRREDHSGWGGSITDDDINILIKIVFTNIQNINQHFSSNSNHGWKIITNTIGSYFSIEQE